MSEVFHLGLTKAMLEGAKLAITPGAPERVERIAKLLDKPKFLASTREFTSWLGYIGDKAVVVCSTGIGGPSVSIAVEELAQLGVRTSDHRRGSFRRSKSAFCTTGIPCRRRFPLYNCVISGSQRMR